jgi:hypothetical protein
MNTEQQFPFTLHTHGGGGFVTFALPSEHLSVPLLSLEKVTLRGDQSRQMILKFSSRSVHLTGTGLNLIQEHLLMGQIKSIQPGTHEQCCIESIQVFEE